MLRALTLRAQVATGVFLFAVGFALRYFGWAELSGFAELVHTHFLQLQFPWDIVSWID
jgi:hypothetical protein